MEADPFSMTHPEHVLSEDLWRMLLELPPVVVSDLLHQRGLHNQIMRHEFLPLDSDAKLVGIARTMATKRLVGEPKAGQEYDLFLAGIDSIEPGDVLVTDKTDCCMWGELCSQAAIRRGGNGIVIDGFHRDSPAIRRLKFPTVSRGRHMSDSLYHRVVTAINDGPVHCGGVDVYPGDLVLGDEDGVVVVPRKVINDVIPKAHEKAVAENQVRVALRNGMSTTEAFRKFGVM